MAAPTKQYGLVLSQKKGLSKSLQKHSVFEDDSDDETTVGESLQKEAVKKKMMKQTRLEMHKALEQDSTVYDYDGVYDDIQKQRLEASKKMLGGTDKKPKYIHQLMRAVEDRKKEQERREERKIHKEREEEGEEFADKEAYVTSAYKLKLQEQKEEQEREKRVEAMEAALDVKKQKDLSGFYRHLLNQTVGEEAIPDGSANKTQNSKLTKDTERTSPPPFPTSHDIIPSSCSDSEEGHEQKSGFSKPGLGSAHSKRQYRQRSPSSGSGEEKEKEKERERHKKRHRDQERDRNRGRERDDRHGGRRDDRDGRRDDRDGRRDDRDGRRDDRDGRRDDRDGRRDDRDGRKDDRDGRKDRDRGREDDRSRGKDTDREDKHGKRERSPKERERDKNGEREKRRNQDEDKRKDKDQEEEKERKKQPENEKQPENDKADGKDPEKKEAVAEQGIEKIDEQKGKEKGEEKEDMEEKANKFVKRSTDQTVGSARDRYMSRQIARSSCKAYIEKEED